MHIVDLTRYLAELSENNNRPWFVMNKPRYDILREEFLVLVTELIAQIAKFDPLVLGCNPKKALFRINRDIRFSKDKSPYKTRFSAAIVAGDLKKPSLGGGPCYYFHMDAEGQLLFAVGEYMPPNDRLKQIRTAIANDGSGLVKAIKGKKLKERFGPLQEEDKLQRPPKGFDPDHPLIELIKMKHFMVWNQVPLKQFKGEDRSEQVLKLLVSGFKDAYPLASWLRSVR